MTSAPSRPVRRVLVALDPAAQCREALETAARLAAGAEAELVGLFVEESDLLQVAGLPVARVVRETDLVLEVLDASKMEQGLKAWAAQARAALAAAAERSQVRASFRVTRGSVSEVLLSEAKSYDLIALGTVGRVSQRHRIGATARLVAREASCSVLLMRGEQQPGQPVVVVYEGSEQALALGSDLARTKGFSLTVISVDGTLAEAARAWLAERRSEARQEVLPGADSVAITERLRRRAASVLVLERKGALGGRIDVEAVLAGPTGSVALVG